MKKFIVLLATAFIFLPHVLGYIQPDPGHFAFQVEWLYVQPSTGDNYYIIDGTLRNSNFERIALPNGERKNNDFDFQSGVRVEGIYAFPSKEYQNLLFRWTYLKADAQRSTAGDFLYFQVINPQIPPFESSGGIVESDLSLTHHSIDALFGSFLYGGPWNLEFRVGIQYAYIRFNEDISMAFEESEIVHSLTRRYSRIHAVGPELALNGYYPLLFLPQSTRGNFAAVFRASGSLLAAQCEKFYRGDATTGTPDVLFFTGTVDDDSFWELITFFQVRGGLNCTTCIGCYPISLEVGYEFTTYLNAIARGRFLNDLSMMITEYQNFGFHGLYLALGAAF